MSNNVKPIPAGYHSLTPYLIVNDAAAALDFYKQALGATEIMRVENEGKICHSEIKIGDSMMMLADENPQMGFVGPSALGNSPISILIYTENVDAIFEKAVAAGATVVRPVQDMFYGDRSGMITDPFGHRWCISTHIEDVSDAEVNARMEKMMAEGACK